MFKHGRVPAPALTPLAPCEGLGSVTLKGLCAAGPLRALWCGAPSRAGTSLLPCLARAHASPPTIPPVRFRARAEAAWGARGDTVPSPAQAPRPRTCWNLVLRACAAVGRPARPSTRVTSPAGPEAATTATGSVAGSLGTDCPGDSSRAPEGQRSAPAHQGLGVVLLLVGSSRGGPRRCPSHEGGPFSHRRDSWRCSEAWHCGCPHGNG